MSAQIKFTAIYFCVIINLTLLVALWLNPSHKIWWNSPSYYNNFKPPTATVWTFNSESNSLLNKNIHMYRGDRSHTGFHYSQINPTELDLVKISEQQINVGIHSASKASATVSKDYIITASDFGLVSVYQNIEKSTKPIWTYMGYNSEKGIHGTPLIVGDDLFWGDYTGIFYSFNLTRRELNWLTDLGDAIGASPNIDSKGYIYLNVETLKPDGYIIKLDSKTGKTIWTSEYLGEQGHSSTTLNESEDLIVFGDNNGNISALKTDSGVFLWKIQVQGPVKSTPAIIDDIAYVTSWDSHLYAINIYSGSIIWKTSINTPISQSSPAVSKVSSVVVAIGYDGICKYSLSSGKKIGCYQTQLTRSTVKSSPIITYDSNTQKQVIWSACEIKSLCAIDLLDMKLIKKWDTVSPITGELTLFNNEIYFITEFSGGLFKLKDSP